MPRARNASHLKWYYNILSWYFSYTNTWDGICNFECTYSAKSSHASLTLWRSPRKKEFTEKEGVHLWIFLWISLQLSQLRRLCDFYCFYKSKPYSKEEIILKKFSVLCFCFSFCNFGVCFILFNTQFQTKYGIRNEKC